jgi:hypothetical protein
MISKDQIQPPAQTPIVNPYITTQMNLLFRARLLWRDLASWLMQYMISLYGGVGNYQEVSERLFRIPAEYGNLFKEYFGDQRTRQYMDLLTQYIALFQSLLDAINKNDVNSINNYSQQLYQNVANNAAFFASINPYWTQGEWQTLLELYTNMQIQEAQTFLTKDYTTNIGIYDQILALATIIGDYFSEGLTIIPYYNFSNRQQLDTGGSLL